MSGTPAGADELATFIRAAKERGVADDFVVTLLRKNGWSERRVFRAFSAHYADTLGLPLPSRGHSTENARDAFYYLLNFITLGFWITALGQIFHVLIARWFPDATQGAGVLRSLRDEISWQLATILVMFPIFAYVHWLIGRNLQLHPELADSAVRKWLTYVALVIAAVIVLGDGVWFVNALLRGELTVRFVLDSLMLLVLGGGVFAYYLATIDPARDR